MDYNLYISELFNYFVAPGVMGGLLIGFSVYLISLGFAKGFEMLDNFGNYEVIED